MRFKLLFTALALSFGTFQYSNAQDTDDGKDYKAYPHMFVGVHGGAQTTFTNYDQGKLITPMYGVSFGAHFNPVVGARLHVSGIQNKGGLKGIDKTYDYKYVNTDIDLMLNLINMFAKNKRERMFNLYLLAGVGLNYAWDNDDFTALTRGQEATYPLAWEDNRTSHNIRAGLMFDFNVAKHFGVNVEVAANNLSDRYNSKTNNKDDWSAYASVGLVYKFGYRKKTVIAPSTTSAVQDYSETQRTDMASAKGPEVETKEKVQEQKAEIALKNLNLYFNISSKELTAKEEAKLKEYITWLKANPNVKVSVVGYADAGTGNPRINQKYSEQRAATVTSALVKGGIDKKRITTDAKGDKVQPFTENDLNRVVIITSEK